MKVAVTGGAGFIGANLCAALLKAGYEVLAFDNFSTGSSDNLAGLDGVTVVRGSVLDATALERDLEEADAIVHLAARPSVPHSIADPMASHRNNATGTANVLEAARRLPRSPHLIVASSSSVYGANPVLPKHEGLKPMPVSPYAATKLAAEAYSLAWAESFGLDVLVFRFFNVFGPLQPAGHSYAAVVPAFVSAALKWQPLPVHGDGRQTRDFTFVDSVTAVISDAIARRITSDSAVNLAFGGRHTLLEVIDHLEKILGRRLQREHQAPRPGDVRDSQADQSTLRTLFPSVEPVGLDEGLSRTVKWFRAQLSSA